MPISSTSAALSQAEPVGLMARIYRMPLSLSDRISMMDFVDRLPPHERVRMETLVSLQPEVLEQAVREAQEIKQAVEEGDMAKLHQLMVLNHLKARLAQT